MPTLKTFLIFILTAASAHAQIDAPLLISEKITPPAYNNGPAVDLGPNGKAMLLREAMSPAMHLAISNGYTIQLEQNYLVFGESQYPTSVHRILILNQGVHYGQPKDEGCVVTIAQESSLTTSGKIISALTAHYEIPKCSWTARRKKGSKETAITLQTAGIVPAKAEPIVAKLPVIRAIPYVSPTPKPKKVNPITIYGKVTNTEGLPVAGFVVHVPGNPFLTETTASDGTYRIESAPRDTSEIQSDGEYNGFYSSTHEDILPSDIAGDEVEKNFVVRDREKEINLAYDAKLAQLKTDLLAQLPTPPKPAEVSVFGLPKEPVVAFLLDNSHTMDAVRGIAIESIKTSLRSLKPNQKFIVGLAAENDGYHFNNGVAVYATLENVEAACAFLGEYHPDIGGERFWQCFKKYKAANPDLSTIYIFTDGIFNKTLEIPQLLDFSENGGIPIVVREMANADHSLLKQVAELSHGRLISGEFSEDSYHISDEQKEEIRKYDEAMAAYNATSAAQQTELERKRQVEIEQARLESQSIKH